MINFFKLTPEKQLLRSAEALAEETARQAQSISDTELAKVLLRAAAFLYDILMMPEPKPEAVRVFGCHGGIDRTENLTGFMFIANILSLKQKELAVMATGLPTEEGLARDILNFELNEGIIGLLGISLVALRLVSPMFSSRSSARNMQYLRERLKIAVYLVTEQAEFEKVARSAKSEDGDAALMEQITIEARRLGYNYPR